MREIIVVDSFSTDDTIAIAGRYTQMIFKRRWEGYAAQKEYALAQATSRWILWVDADEEISGGLRAEIAALPEDGGDVKGYNLPRLTRYMGRWIRHCGWYPGYILRLFRKDSGGFNSKPVHEGVEVAGRCAYLREPILHYSYRDLAHHVGKMDAFTTLAANDMFKRGRRTTLCAALSRTLFKFVKMFVLRAGFLDGRAGLVVCVMAAWYEFLNYAKLIELQEKEKASA